MYNAQLRYVAEQQKAGNAFALCPERTLPVADASSPQPSCPTSKNS